jgi:hypothetical protein
MNQKQDVRATKETLLRIFHEAVLLQYGKDCGQVLEVNCRVGAVNEDIVQVDEGQPARKRVHEPLECHAIIVETKGHTDELEQAE